MIGPDMHPAAVLARLRRVADLTDLSAANRLAYKVDYTPAAVTRRLRQVSHLRRLCLALGSREPGRDPEPGGAP